MKCETYVLQDRRELAAFTELLQRENVRSYLEIGSKHGGSLWIIARALPKGSRVVSVDLPHGDTSFKETEPTLKECVVALKGLGYDAHLFLGDSTDQSIVKAVEALGPFDACFIDANHTVPYVRSDWHNYGPMARMVAFHDIGWIQRPQPGKKPIEVPQVWNEIKGGFRHQEIKMCPRDNGIGIIWRN